MQCLWVIIRKTYGWHKKEDFISLSQFTSFTGIKKPRVLRLLQKLQSKNIVIIKNDNDIGNTYRFNKDFDTWIPLSKKITTFIPESSLKKFCYLCKFEDAIEKHHIIPLHNNGLDKVENKIVVCPNCHSLIHKGKISREILLTKKAEIESGIIQNDNTTEIKALSKKGTTKENYTKETITKEIYGEFKNIRLSKEEYQKLIQNFGEIKAKAMIENISTSLASKGDKYKSHYATILNWERMNPLVTNQDDPYSNLKIVGAKNGHSD